MVIGLYHELESQKTDGQRGIIGIEEEISNERILKSYRMGQGTFVRFGDTPKSFFPSP